jgi:hypothetical protein
VRAFSNVKDDGVEEFEFKVVDGAGVVVLEAGAGPVKFASTGAEESAKKKSGD